MPELTARHTRAAFLGAVWLGLAAAATAQAPAALQHWQAARDTVLAQRGQAPADYCDADANWIFFVLAQLDAAVAADAAVRGLIEQEASDFAAFRRTPEFTAWWTATGPQPAGAAERRAFLVRHAVWTRPGESGERESMRFASNGTVAFHRGARSQGTGRWSVRSDGAVLLIRRGREQALELTAQPFAIRAGAMRFTRMLLGDWVAGPLTHDCDF